MDISSHTKNLSFAIAPTDIPTLPYKFKTVEGGKFIAGSYYGSIERKEFSLVCVLFEEENGTSTDDDDDSKEKSHEQEEETDSEYPAISGSYDHEEPQKSDSPSSEKDQPTGSKKSSATSSMKNTNGT